MRPLAPTQLRMDAAGVSVGPETTRPRGADGWLDVGWAIDVLRPASHADVKGEDEAHVRR